MGIEQSGYKFISQEISQFSIEIDTQAKQKKWEKMRAWLAILTQEDLIDEVLADYANFAKSSAHLAALGIKDLGNKVLPPIIDNQLF